MLTFLAAGAISTVDSSAVYDLGTITFYKHPTYGPQFWRYVYNNSGSDIAANLGVMQEDGTDLHQVALSDAGVECARLLGVTQHAIAAGKYGWVLASGFGLLTSNGSTTANTGQKGVASGQFADGTVGTDELPVWACATEDPAGAGGTFIGRVKAL